MRSYEQMWAAQERHATPERCKACSESQRMKLTQKSNNGDGHPAKLEPADNSPGHSQHPLEGPHQPGIIAPQEPLNSLIGKYAEAPIQHDQTQNRRTHIGHNHCPASTSLPSSLQSTLLTRTSVHTDVKLLVHRAYLHDKGARFWSYGSCAQRASS